MTSEFTPTFHAETAPERAAIVMGISGEITTYAQLEDRSKRFANILRQRGLQAGDHVAICMENNAAYLEVLWAAQRSGLVYTAINRHLRAVEVQYVLDDCGAKALITSPVMAGVLAELDLANVDTRVSVGASLDGFEDYSVLLDASSPELDDEQEGREMLYSSGTTGRPKGVVKELQILPLGDPAAAPVQIAQGIALTGITAGAVYLSPAPLYHASPLVYSMSMHRLGATVVVMEHFEAEQCLSIIDRFRITHAQFVPTMFVRLLRLPEERRAAFDVSSLKSVTHAAAPCPVTIKQQMIDWWGPILLEFYSGTEDIGGTFITSPEWLEHPGSVGRPLQECHIVGDDDQELPAGQIGTVYFAGGRPFEYHNDPEKTASIANENGWRTLGDVGYLDADGYLYLTDRKAHMIISGGVNIYPQEAENVLLEHRAVADVAVIGVPNEEMGEEVKAVVELAEDADASDALGAELVEFCRQRLAGYKCPRSVDFVEQLPRTDTGKLYKRLLKEQYWDGRISLIS